MFDKILITIFGVSYSVAKRTVVMTEADDGSPSSCFARIWDFLRCKRKYRDGAEYIVLKSSDDVDVEELECFLKDNFENLGISMSDLTEIDRESEITRHLLKLLPVYKRCVRRYSRLDKLLSNKCKPHLRNAAEIECQKSKRVVEALDIVMLKLLVGEFSFSEEDSIERLLEKFSVDQTTLCEVSKIVRLIDMDLESSRKLMDSKGMEASSSDAILYELENIPPVPDHIPESISSVSHLEETEQLPRHVGQRAAADGDDRKIKITTV